MESNDTHFLTFLSKDQIAAYHQLSEEDKESVKLHIHEKAYFTQRDVLVLMNEALSAKEETLETRLLRSIPESVKPNWSALTPAQQKSMLGQARLFTEMKNEADIENFWLTRSFKLNETKAEKKLIEQHHYLKEDRLSEDFMANMIAGFERI